MNRRLVYVILSINPVALQIFWEFVEPCTYFSVPHFPSGLLLLYCDWMAEFFSLREAIDFFLSSQLLNATASPVSLTWHFLAVSKGVRCFNTIYTLLPMYFQSLFNISRKFLLTQMIRGVVALLWNVVKITSQQRAPNCWEKPILTSGWLR